ncbi:MraY family glycosyltransferase [Arcanobacterium hippocoleae]|uniref:UDP-GlcNAc:undecaprenyl-phosphate GlcNAc-1-phosphate transferase n=1 Tax=Arcanobacterium hippocoleae TaxID=149017 RepID=A0ABU1T528_9ACTO|nr:MraY family glycosyltransferase [Arcanobacterium hippocoleae]MDR6939976.1 UDP-GlcNAc:undecaprenyl-phosphate GlcNAc-1-phosphate transferase [Arcanobacterium hippocoleae]
MRVYLLMMLLAGVITYLLVPLILHLALSLGAITQVRGRDVHTVPIARLGGVAMFLGLAFTFVIASQIPFLAQTFIKGSGAWGVLFGAGAMCLLGAIDDIWELRWYAKLAGEILAAAIMAWFGVQLLSVPLLGLTIGSDRLTLFSTIFVVLVAANAVNFIDGLDGLAAGVVGIAALAFFGYAYYFVRESSPGDYASVGAAVVAVLVGICLGFLPHNFHQARIFMGDSGALMLGSVIAGASITVTGQIDPANLTARMAIPAFMPLFVPILVLSIPLIDMSWAVIRRVSHGKSPFEADAGHLHHRLLRLGHSHVNAVLILYLWAAVGSFNAVTFVIFPARFVIIPAGLMVVFAIFMTLRVLSKQADCTVAAATELAGAREENHVPEVKS